MKGQALQFEPVGRPLLPPLGCPLETNFRVEIEDQRQVRPIRADRQPLKGGDELRRQVPRRALIGAGQIREPVGNDPGAARQRRQNRRVEMVDTGGGEQERLRGGFKPGCEAGKNRLTQRLGARRPPGLARPDDGKPERGEALLEPPGLNRFPCPLPALEGDKSASCLFGHRLARRRAASVSILVQSRRTEPTANPSSKRCLKGGSSQHGSARIGNARRLVRRGPDRRGAAGGAHIEAAKKGTGFESK